MSRFGAVSLVLAVLMVGAWLALLTGTGALWAGAASVAVFFALGVWRPRLALGVLVAFAAATPLASSLAGVPWFSAAEGGLLALGLAVAWRERTAPRRPRDLAGTLVLLFALYVVLATVALWVRYRYTALAPGLVLLGHPLSDLLQLKQAQPFYGFRAGTLLLEGMLAFLLARRVDAEPGEGRATLWGLWAGGCVAGASYFIFYLPHLLEPWKNWVTYRPALTLHDPNSAASFGLLVLGAGLALALRWRRGGLLFMLPGLLILFCGGSRVAYGIALVGSLCVIVLVLWARLRRRGQPFASGDLAGAPALAPALVVLLLLGAALVFLMVQSKQFQRLASGEVFTVDRFSGRLGYWEAGRKMVTQWPISGVGAGEFPLVLPQYAGWGMASGDSPHENAHCYPLQLAAEYGLPGLLLWLGVLWVVLAPRLRQWRVLSPEAGGLLIGTLFYLLHSLQSHPLLLPEQQILFWAALGGLAGHFNRLAEPSGPSPLRWVAPLCLLAPLWSLTQPLPAAAEARSFGLYASGSPSGTAAWRWTGPEAWILVEGGQPQSFLLGVPRPDLSARPVTVTLDVGGAPLWSGRPTARENLRMTLDLAPGKRGALLHMAVDPPLVPREWNPAMRDTRALGVQVTTPVPSALPTGGEPAGSAGGVRLFVAAEEGAVLSAAGRRCACEGVTVPPTAQPGSVLEIPATFRNLSPGAWPGTALANSSHPLGASYHWRHLDGETEVWDGARTPVKSDVAPGAGWSGTLQVQVPAEPGVYRLELDLVQEGVAWFSCGGAPAEVVVEYDRPKP